MQQDIKQKNYADSYEAMYEKILKIGHAMGRTLKRMRDFGGNLSDSDIEAEVDDVLAEMRERMLSYAVGNARDTHTDAGRSVSGFEDPVLPEGVSWEEDNGTSSETQTHEVFEF